MSDKPKTKGFYESIINKLVESRLLNTSNTILVLAGGRRDLTAWEGCGFNGVTISNLDNRLVGNEFSPYEWSYQDAEKLTFPEDSVDFVVIHNGLHHCRCPQIAILEMMRVAKKGVLIFEPYDNVVTRLGIRLGLGQEYETAAVFYNEGKHGGLRNGPVANFVYRFTQRELSKLISTAYPEGPIEIQFFHKLLIPWGQLRGRKSRIPLMLAWLAMPFLKVLEFAVPTQCNSFAAYIRKRSSSDQVWPWVERRADGECCANMSWMKDKYEGKSSASHLG
jgi:SAM-dependent methyltransferase